MTASFMDAPLRSSPPAGSQTRSSRTPHARTPHARSPRPRVSRTRAPHTPSFHQSSATLQPIPLSPQSIRRRTRRFYYLTLFSEASLKILINGLLLSAFAIALGRLLPQMWRNHQQRLAIETELELVQARVNTLEQRFSQTFDPSASLNLIENQSYQVDPQKQRIVLLSEED